MRKCANTKQLLIDLLSGVEEGHKAEFFSAGSIRYPVLMTVEIIFNRPFDFMKLDA